MQDIILYCAITVSYFIGVHSQLSNTLLDINREKFIDKWGFDLNYYSNSRNDMLNFIEADRSENSMEVGCGCGATLSKIKYLWQNTEVAGIELLDNVVGFIRE